MDYRIVKIILIPLILFLSGRSLMASQACYNTTQEKKNIQLVKNMFQQVIANHDLSKMPVYFSKKSLFYYNNSKISYAQNFRIHKKLYKTLPKIGYHFDEIFSSGQRVFVRYTFDAIVKHKVVGKFRSLLLLTINHNKITSMHEIYIPYKPYSKPKPNQDITKLS